MVMLVAPRMVISVPNEIFDIIFGFMNVFDAHRFGSVSWRIRNVFKKKRVEFANRPSRNPYKRWINEAFERMKIILLEEYALVVWPENYSNKLIANLEKNCVEIELVKEDVYDLFTGQSSNRGIIDFYSLSGLHFENMKCVENPHICRSCGLSFPKNDLWLDLCFNCEFE